MFVPCRCSHRANFSAGLPPRSGLPPPPPPSPNPIPIRRVSHTVVELASLRWPPRSRARLTSTGSNNLSSLAIILILILYTTPLYIYICDRKLVYIAIARPESSTFTAIHFAFIAAFFALSCYIRGFLFYFLLIFQLKRFNVFFQICFIPSEADRFPSDESR